MRLKRPEQAAVLLGKAAEALRNMARVRISCGLDLLSVPSVNRTRSLQVLLESISLPVKPSELTIDTNVVELDVERDMQFQGEVVGGARPQIQLKFKIHSANISMNHARSGSDTTRWRPYASTINTAMYFFKSTPRTVPIRLCTHCRCRDKADPRQRLVTILQLALALEEVERFQDTPPLLTEAATVVDIIVDREGRRR